MLYIDEIIEATDAGREGECIFRYIYDYIGCTKPVTRLWISSMTEASIRAGFDSLKPVSDYDKLYNAGFTRSKIDWLWGMNLTRLYTNCFGTKCSIGRVRTAVLNMLVMRENEIKSFTKHPFYKIKLDNGAEWFNDEQDSFEDKSIAERKADKCRNQPCKVVYMNAQPKKENRPLLFSLTSLQIAANDELGFSAAKTLAIMQSLYEKKLLTYPRKAIIESEKGKEHTRVVNPNAAGVKAPLGKCPKCGGAVYKYVRDNKAVFYCENAPKSCFFRVYEDDYFFLSKGKKLTEGTLKTMLSKGVVKISGLKSEKTGKTYDALVSFTDRTDKNGNAKVGFTMRFDDKSKKGGR